MSSNDTSSAVPPMVGLPQPWGVLMIGFWISLILMGIVIVQTWNYYCSFPEDSKWIKLYVVCLFVADFLSSFFLMYWIYDLFIVNWGDPIPYGLIHWALASDPILGGIIGPMVHAFYAWRIHVISKTWWISATIMVFSLMALGGGIAGTHAARTLSTLAELANNVQLVATFWLLPAAIADLIITITLTYYLRKHKGRFQQSDRILDKIIHLTIQNGLLTASAAILDFIIYSAVATPYHIALTFILPKLYANTVLSSLNSRSAIRKDVHSSGSNTADIQLNSTSSQFPPRFKAGRTAEEVIINIGVERHEMRDNVKRDTRWSGDGALDPSDSKA